MSRIILAMPTSENLNNETLDGSSIHSHTEEFGYPLTNEPTKEVPNMEEALLETSSDTRPESRNSVDYQSEVTNEDPHFRSHIPRTMPPELPQFVSNAPNTTTTVVLIDRRASLDFIDSPPYYILHFPSCSKLSMKHLTKRFSERGSTFRHPDCSATVRTWLRKGVYKLAVYGGCSLADIVMRRYEVGNLPWKKPLCVVEDQDLDFVLTVIDEQRMCEEWERRLTLERESEDEGSIKSDGFSEWPVVVMELEEQM